MTAEPKMWKALAEILRPQEYFAPSVFAEKYRTLSEKEAEKPGPWSNDFFPALGPIMDSVESAMDEGKRGWCLMKVAQGGGSQAVINCWAWMQTYFPGPILYMISKDEVAEEFGRERFTHCLDTMEPLKRKALRGRAGGESLTKKRFMDGKLVICGGRSVLNLQSQPYRFVLIDEVDSLLDQIGNEGDPIKLAEMRLNAFRGQTLMMAFAHPTTKERGAAKLFYKQSDQRRGFCECVHCKSEIWFSWENVRVVPGDGLTKDQAARDARYYEMFCPDCGTQITDAERVAMLRGGIKYKSELDPAEAARRQWVGVHYSVLYMPNWTLKRVAEQYVAALDSEPMMQVFHNKMLGEPFEVTVEEQSAEDWRKLIVVPRPMPEGQRDPRAYYLGEVPEGVQLLTAGQDSRSVELHFSVWGWGWKRTASGHLVRNGWLIDYGVHERPYSLTLDASELELYDQLVFDRVFKSLDDARVLRVHQCGMDSGWQPEAVYGYARKRPGVAVAVKGGNDTGEDFESTNANIRWSAAPTYAKGDVVRDSKNRPAILNTFNLKVEFYNLAARRVQVDGSPEPVACLHLPIDVGEDFLEQITAEKLTKVRKRGRDVQVWKRIGPNHWLDTAVYAFAMAQNLAPFQPKLPFDEQKKKSKKKYGIVGKAF